MNIEQEAAQSLIARAFSTGRQSEADLLIGAAKRLDPAINAEKIQARWLEQWLEANRNRTKESSR